ncbi:unnamed protein product [Cylindrotheca closterium]|uniref:AAA+ ATPase domain-containing protein n=1 Tax=Cylindrotheca closterium TaxID=2856 RepID=A0AAD2G5I0_9STRA|nr:unnamed protein product [Cylindrotheca closterium]
MPHHHHHHHHHPYYDFDQMSSLIKRLDVIENEAPSLLQAFYEPRLKSFSIKPEIGSRKRVCVTSTCYALVQLAISKIYDITSGYGAVITYDNSMERGKGDEDNENVKIPIPKVVDTLLRCPFRESDLFQIPLLAYSILQVDDDRSMIRSAAKSDPQVAAKFKTMLSTVLKAAPDRKLGSNQVHSDYVQYQVCKLIALLHDYTIKHQSDDNNGSDDGYGGLPEEVLPDNIATDAFWVLLSCAEVSSNEVCRQLAYRVADDLGSFDVMRLAYSLLTYVRSTTSLSGMSGKEMVEGEGPSPETRIPQLNQKLVAAALAAFFKEQNIDGMWDRGQPIYKSLSRGKRRDMGNAFVFPVNIVGSLLQMLPAEAFRPHLAALDRTLQWIESHQRFETVVNYCDEETGNVYGKPMKGWSSPHLNPSSGPEAWPTAQVLKCTLWMRQTIRELVHNDVLEEFNGIAFSKQSDKNGDDWDTLLDADLGGTSPTSDENMDSYDLGGSSPTSDGTKDPNDSDTDSGGRNSCRTIKDVLEQRVIQPFAASIENPSYGAAYSAILFGPPGGAKTSLTEALARKMGYDYVCIDTADFLADGLTNVAARIRYVFNRLMALQKCVILFDEIEEFAMDRKLPSLSMESRMLTTAMLTAINDLRRKEQSIFFIATNRLDAFDSAITRPGRIDMTLFVGTPNLESRVTQFRQQLARVRHVRRSETSAVDDATGDRDGGEPEDSLKDDDVKPRKRKRRKRKEDDENQAKDSRDADDDDDADASDEEYQDPLIEESISTFRFFLQSVWSEDAMFMNYLEGVQFASACADLVSSHQRPPTVREMKMILRQQAAVMTVRGAAREEFLTSMEMSRF